MKKIAKKAFTLVEIMVALTIFWIILLSVISIYIFSTEVTYSSDINRSLQENIKNIVTEISEDTMKNWIKWVSNANSSNCDDWTLLELDSWKVWKIFCTGEYLYFLWQKKWDSFSIASSDICDKTNREECFLLRKKISENEIYPVSNSLVKVRDVKFLISNEKFKKVTISLKLQPSLNSWVKTSFLERNIFNFQTTLTQRYIKK